jgi:hypothetical protein
MTETHAVPSIQSLPKYSTEGGTQIEERDEQPEKTESSILESFELLSNVIVERHTH